ncbi:MAG: hypothetical protein WAU07_04580, partial [Microgenomates group bacterium]
MLSQMDLKTLKKVFIWWIVLTAFWTAYRLFTFPELFTEVIAKPIIWLGITFIFLSFGLIPKKTLVDLKTYYLQIRPLWKIITLPALFVTLYFFLINYR